MQEIKRSLVKASKIYSDQTIIRAGINLIPFIGGALDVLLSSSGQNFVIRRLESFISELNNQISQLDENKINKDFLRTEEGFDLLIKSFESASKTRQIEKLKLYAKIIKGSLLSGKEYQEDDPELYLKIVEELSVKELRVAKFLYESKNQSVIDRNFARPQNGFKNDSLWLSNKYPEFNKDELVTIFVRLERTGLIKELVGGYSDYTGGHYQINPLFIKFIDFIEGID